MEKNLQSQKFLSNFHPQKFMSKHQGVTNVHMRYIEVNFYRADMEFVDMQVKQTTKYGLKKCSQILYDITKTGCQVPIIENHRSLKKIKR